MVKPETHKDGQSEDMYSPSDVIEGPENPSYQGLNDMLPAFIQTKPNDEQSKWDVVKKQVSHVCGLQKQLEEQITKLNQSYRQKMESHVRKINNQANKLQDNFWQQVLMGARMISSEKQFQLMKHCTEINVQYDGDNITLVIQMAANDYCKNKSLKVSSNPFKIHTPIQHKTAPNQQYLITKIFSKHKSESEVVPFIQDTAQVASNAMYWYFVYLKGDDDDEVDGDYSEDDEEEEDQSQSKGNKNANSLKQPKKRVKQDKKYDTSKPQCKQQ